MQIRNNELYERLCYTFIVSNNAQRVILGFEGEDGKA